MILELQHLKAAAPKSSDVEAYHKWKGLRDSLRAAIQNESSKQLANARIAGMTTTYAVLHYQALQEVGKASLVVMDEASQIGNAYAMMLARLGKRCLFAGDPRQLSPIVQSDKCEYVGSWLGKSPLGWLGLRTDKQTVTLEEQFRMAAPISLAVKKAFYPDIDLRVADTKRHDVKWTAARQPLAKHILSDGHICLIYVDSEAQNAPEYQGYVCPESVDVAIAVAAHLAKELQNTEERILILTPYRAQRSALESRMRQKGIPQTKVRTVHSVQGSEARFVILDPVRPSAEFVNDEGGRRLLNVAMSRAQGQLIIILQRDFTTNDVLRQLRAQFSDRRLSPEAINAGLGLKFEKTPSTPPVTAIVAPPIALPRTLADEFSADLNEKLSLLPRDSPFRNVDFMSLSMRVKYRLALSQTEKEAIYKALTQ